MLKKQYDNAAGVCIVTFTLKKEEARGADRVYLVGDFNNWSCSATPMELTSSGNFESTIRLTPEREYQFRYFIDGTRWENDWNADKYLATPHGDADNSVVIV